MPPPARSPSDSPSLDSPIPESTSLEPTRIAWSRRALEVAVCAFILSPSLLFPICRDHGLFAYCGQIILDGGIPYRDVYEQKGPATHYTFALILAVFGATPWAIRFFFFLVGVLGSQLAASLGQRLLNRHARLACAGSYALVSIQGLPTAPGMSAQVEDFILPLTLAAILLVADGVKIQRLLNVFIAWCLLGLACVYKPTALPTCLTVGFVSAVWYLALAELPRWKLAACVGAALLGFLLPLAAFAVLLWSNAAFDDFWMFVVDHNTRVYAKLKIGTPAFAIAFFFFCWGRLGLLAAPSAMVGYRRQPLLWSLLMAVIVGGLLSVIMQWKFVFAYHWTPFVGALSIFAGLSLGRILSWAADRDWSPRRRTAAYAAVLLLALLIPTSTLYWFQLTGQTLQVVAGMRSLSEHQSSFPVGSDRMEIQHAVAGYVRQRTRPDETVLVWGMDVVLNFLSDRRSPSRFALNRTLMHHRSPHIQAWRGEFLASLHAKPPAYVIVANDAEAWRPWYESKAQDDLSSFEELQEFLDNEYSWEERIGSFDIYRFRNQRPTNSGRVSRRRDAAKRLTALRQQPTCSNSSSH